jgi:hypothetical protein
MELKFVGIQVDRIRARVVVQVPVDVGLLRHPSWLWDIVHLVCGPEPIADAMISGAVGALAFCRSDGVEEWRQELGLRPADWL